MEYFQYFREVLRKYSIFTGRSRRKEYWYYFIVNVLIAIGLSIIGSILKSLLGTDVIGNAMGIIFTLALLVPGTAVTIRRLHDTGRSGWWILISLIPFVGAIILLVLLAADSQPGENKYGPNPKGVPIKA